MYVDQVKKGRHLDLFGFDNCMGIVCTAHVCHRLHTFISDQLLLVHSDVVFFVFQPSFIAYQFMRLTSGFAALVVGGISCLPTAFAWGAAGMITFPIL